MADFCTDCAKELGLPWPDIDIELEAQAIEPGEYVSVLCEGCSLMRIGKDENGKVLVGYVFDGSNWEDPIKMVPYEERHTIRPKNL